MKILVTGAGGFIGRHLVSSLRENHDVIAIAREPTGMDGVQELQIDLAQPVDLTALPARIDAVIHLAQSRRYRDFPDGADDVFAVNVDSTLQLLEYARRAGAQTFLFASTGGVYGYGYEKLSETDPVDPLNFYLSSKYAAELLIANYRRFFSTIVFRFFFVYGPGQAGMLVPTLVNRVLADETVSIDGNPGIRINPIYVGDAVRTFEPALALGQSGLFNIAGDEEVTLTDLVQIIGEITGRTPRIEHNDVTADGDLVGDNRQMKDALGIRPEMLLREGLARIADSAQ
ncbi:MAG TPA: NAD(P)-dependent oxidoreductase [Microbacteriaceae bacterium]|jgi:nucleoside-diphosphate-sugar epimerase|nr:NAD(P)-dependent oxidoreductase [Microbacteriaceae bacterium]